MCWRQRGSSEVHNSHTFWKYSKLSSYWKAINNILYTVFKMCIPLNTERLLLGHTVFLKLRRDDQYDSFRNIYLFIKFLTLFNSAII